MGLQTSRMTDAFDRARNQPAFWLTATFCLAGLAVLLHHELSLDELQAWVIARESATLGELHFNLRYGGHPSLWPLALYLLAGFTADPLAMQLLHLGIATAAIYVLARWAPFPTWQKALLTFGYFPFYEYAVISRNYALGMLFTFAACAALVAGPQRYLIFAGLLFLLTQTSVYGVILAGALAAAWAMTWMPREHNGDPGGVGRLLIVALFLALGAAVAALQMMPPADGGYAAGWRTQFELEPALHTVKRIWKGLVPVPELKDAFWNSNILDSVWKGQVLLALALYAGVTLVLAHRPVALLFWLLASGGLLLFAYTKHSGAVRHDGILFVALTVAFWLATWARGSRSPRLGNRINRALDVAARQRPRLFAALLIVHLGAGFYAAAKDYALPFSRSRDTARYIAESVSADIPIVGYPDYTAAVVAAWLGRPFFFPSSGRSGTRVIYDNRRGHLDQATLLARVADLKARTRTDILLVLSYPLTSAPPDIELLRSYTGAILARESYYLYLARYAP